MKVTIDNYKDIKYIEGNNKNIELLHSLLIDLNELNNEVINHGEKYRQLYIDYIDTHMEYSPERTDPCPDYYGMFRLVFEENPYENVGGELTLDELDTVMCALINFEESRLS